MYVINNHRKVVDGGLMRGIALCVVVLAGVFSSAAPPHVRAADVGAQQVAGLFMLTCMQYLGNRDGLLGFLAERRVPSMPSQAAERFLRKPGEGKVFDASRPGTRLALVSHDNGLCSVFSDTASGPESVALTLQNLHDLKVPVKLVRESTHPNDPSLKNQGFEGEYFGRAFQMVLSSSSQVGRMQVMFSVWPNQP
ncbi:MAG: hypothetical protein LDL39_00670 [Magnetospirillum sp.]|nr:hypothetical protein [Magnetospirillum sp.]